MGAGPAVKGAVAVGVELVVGYDGSDPSRMALRWGLSYAVASQARLCIVHAWIWPLFTHDVGPVKGVADSGLRHAAEEILSEGVDFAHRTSPGLDIEPRMAAGLPAEVLREESLGADLLVVGSRGLGGFLGKLAGSVSVDLSRACPCPLVVVKTRDSDVLRNAVQWVQDFAPDLAVTEELLSGHSVATAMVEAGAS